MITSKREITLAKLTKVADLLKVMAHPVRLEILEALEVEKHLSVGAIQDLIASDVEQSLLSHHLIKMKDKGLLTCHREGKSIHYAITDTEILKIFDCLENCKLIL